MEQIPVAQMTRSLPRGELMLRFGALFRDELHEQALADIGDYGEERSGVVMTDVVFESIAATNGRAFVQLV